MFDGPPIGHFSEIIRHPGCSACRICNTTRPNQHHSPHPFPNRSINDALQLPLPLSIATGGGNGNPVYFSGIFISTTSIAAQSAFQQYLAQKYNVNDATCNGPYATADAAKTTETEHINQLKGAGQLKVEETNWVP